MDSTKYIGMDVHTELTILRLEESTSLGVFAFPESLY
jgi:hypothetical protein